MTFFIDQTERIVILNKTPSRIVSVVPSQTELLYDLGLNETVVGITKFCVHPEEWFQTKTKVGGTKQLDIELIKQLKPDLIIANKEENIKEQVEELEKDFPVWVSDAKDLDDAYEMMEKIGTIVNKEQQAETLITRIKENFSQLPINDYRLRTCYLIWQKPYMTVGGDTFIHSMMEIAGFENIFRSKSRYPEITVDELNILDCQLLLLSSEPFPFKQKHAEEIKVRGFKGKIVLADGEMFGWYGSRLLKTPEYFTRLQKQIELSQA